MRFKIIVTVFICLCSNLGFSQTKKLLHSFERRLETSPPRYDVSCWGRGQYKHCKEDYNIRLFSDSTFLISYSRTGNRYPELYQILEGHFFKSNTRIYLLRDSVINTFSKSLLSNGEGLGEVLNIGIPLKIEYSGDALSFNNSAGPFLVFRKENILDKYKNSKPASVVFHIPVFSPQFSNNPISF